MPRLFRFWFGLVIALSCASCSDPPRATYAVSGAVTYGGRPVPAGVVSFLPDGTAGNLGPTGSALIQDGRYDLGTSGGPRSFGGVYRVIINGYRVAPGDAHPNEPPLFPPYEVRVELPPEDCERNFDVPAGPSRPQPRP